MAPRRIPRNYFAADSRNSQYLPSEFEQTYDRLRTSRNVEDTRGDYSIAGERVGDIIAKDERARKDPVGEYRRREMEFSEFSPQQKKEIESLINNFNKTPSERPSYSHEATVADIGSFYDDSLSEMSYKVPKK